MTLTPEKKKYLPGERVKVAVAVADQNGKPARAEISLAVVDEALHALARGAAIKLSEQFFGRDLSERPLLVAGSNTFHYAAEARQRALIVKESDSLLRSMIVGGSATVSAARGEGWGRVPANHYAYEALEKLGDLGVLDAAGVDRYKGKQATRLELGAMLGRAMQNGQSLGEPLARDLLTDLQREFSDELRALGYRDVNEAAARRQAGAAGKAGPAGQAGGQADGSIKALMGSGGGGSGFGLTPAAPPSLNLSDADKKADDESELEKKILRMREVYQGGFAAVIYRSLDHERTNFSETAFWSPFVVTDESGKATVEFVLPDSLTEWRLDARAITMATLTGEGQSSVTAAKPFIAELKLPAVLQERDKLQLAASVRNTTDQAAQSIVTLKANGKELGRQTVEVPANGVKELTFPLTVPAGTTMELELSAVAGTLKDTMKQAIGIRAYGGEHVAAKSGTATGDRLVEVALADRKYRSQQMTITVGPSVDRALLDAVNPSGMAGRIVRPAILDSATARAQMLVASVKYLRVLGRGDTPEHGRFVADLESALARLVASQNDDGGWAWAQRGKASDVFVTAQAIEAFAEAKRLGLPASQERLSKALGFLAKALAQSSEQDHTRRAAILSAQAAAATADFAHANRLLRLRNSLDTRALCLTMIALADMDRAPNARELQSVLEERVKRESGLAIAVSGSTAGASPSLGVVEIRYGGDESELTALALLALAKTDAKSALLEPLAQGLWSRRVGTSWGTPAATAAAVRALAFYSSLVKPRSDNYTLTVSVNDRELKKLEVTGATRTTELVVPTELLTDLKAKVNFALSGSGEYAYGIALHGFSEETKAKEDQFVIRRDFLPAPLVYEGKAVPRGFGAVADAARRTFVNYAKEVALGKHVQVSLRFDTTTNATPGAYFAMREQLPSGAKVLEETVQGNFEHFQLTDGEITFYFRAQAQRFVAGYATFDAVGATAGEFEALPTRAWSYYRPEQYGLAAAKPFKVLARDEKGTDVYRMTPDELLFLGAKAFEKLDYVTAHKQLSELFNNYQLQPNAERDSARMLFVANLETADTGGLLARLPAGSVQPANQPTSQPTNQPANPAAEAVRFFEILHDKYPNVVITFRDLTRVAKAYRALNEREREAAIFRTTSDALFGKEARVAGVLNEEGEFLASVDFTRRLLRLFPDLSSVESAWLGLAQELDGRAADKSKPLVGRAGIPDPQLTHAKLADMALVEFRQFTVLYTASPAAPDASFSLASALLRLERLDEAIAWTARARDRYAATAYVDDFEYIAAYAHFLNEEFADALSATQLLTTQPYLRPDGTRGPSEHRDFAIYIAAQVFHSQGKAAEAVKEYERVAEHFADAREALGYIKRKQVGVPEVTIVSRDEPVLVQLVGRNIKEAEITVYKVDLLKFYQQHRSLKDVAKMNLAGIKPLLETKVTLGAGPSTNGAKPSDYEEVKHTVPLTLSEKGAYFVLVKGEGVAASGVVLRSDLNVEVQEDTDSGRVRVNVVNRAFNRFQPKTEVWVVGSANDGFRKGQSDLRGVLVADDVRGLATVIAHKDGEYAFYRGQTILQPASVAASTLPMQTNAPARKPQSAAEAEQQFKDQATKNLFQQNADLQNRGRANFQQQLRGGMGGGGLGNTAGKAF